MSTLPVFCRRQLGYYADAGDGQSTTEFWLVIPSETWVLVASKMPVKRQNRVASVM
jgi:hypothetical protein